MKHVCSLLILALFAILPTRNYAQSMKGFNYQAVARDAAGTILSNTTINLQFQVRETTAAGNLIYQEKHRLETNDFGLFQTIVGKGDTELGDFSTINWNQDDYYLVVELNGNAMDAAYLESVPYSKVATAMRLNDLMDTQGSPNVDDVLTWDGTQWTPASPSISLSGVGATSVSGTFPNFTISSTDNVNDADASTTNEIQSMNLSGNTLSLSLGGGSVSLANFASPWNNSGSNLYFNTGKVGIGDNSPVATFTVGNGDKFQVNGSDGDLTFKDDQGSIKFANANGSNAPMIHMFTSGTNNSTRMLVAHSPNFSSWGIQYNDTADAFNWIGDNQPIFQIQLSGQQRVGIGTFSPEAKLHINANSSTGVGHLKLTEEQFDYSRITMNNNIHNTFWDIAARTDTNLANAQFNIYHKNVGDIFSINARRRVGINDATPGYPLEVNGNGQRRGINLYNTLPAETGTTSNYGLLSTLSQSSTSGTPRLYSVFGQVTDADSYLSYGVYGRADNAANFDYGVYGRSSTTTGYAVYASGNTYTTGAYQSSDERLKRNIRELRSSNRNQSASQILMQLRPTVYEFDTERYTFMNLPEGDQYGFSAQEVELHLPTLVKETFQPYDEPLSDTEEGQGLRFKALNYIGMIPIIVAGIQEQQTQMDRQNLQLDSYQRSIVKLEKALEQKKNVQEALEKKLVDQQGIIEAQEQKINALESRFKALEIAIQERE